MRTSYDVSIAVDGGTPSTRTLRQLITSNDLSFLMEAHDGLSAAVAAQAGFAGLWASGLSIASSLGFRDANEAAWTHLLDVVERMTDATDRPVLVDGDSGFGNFNNARLAALKLWQRGAGGMCIEDKGFPKMNSFVGDRHPLAEVDEFGGRLRAIKDHVPDQDFVLVARVEALIAGHDMQEALDRAFAYAEAGADAILIHSRKSEAAEILCFAEAWENLRPLVVVPTKYFRTPVAVYRAAGISTVIWANHSMRAAVSGMRAVCSRIMREESIAGVEPEIATLDEVFGLLNYAELAAAECTYLPRAAPSG